ncbi:hypothetical protein [Nocardia sp. NPDC003963]
MRSRDHGARSAAIVVCTLTIVGVVCIIGSVYALRPDNNDGPGGEMACGAPVFCTATLHREVAHASVEFQGSQIQLVSVDDDSVAVNVDPPWWYSDQQSRLELGKSAECAGLSLNLTEITDRLVVIEVATRSNY